MKAITQVLLNLAVMLVLLAALMALAALIFVGRAGGAPPGRPGPEAAVVRITSHGISGTVISTQPGRTLILTCGHGFEDRRDRLARIVVDAPAPRGGAVKTGGIRLVRLNARNDLALIEMTQGPLPYVTPVAARDVPPGSWCYSIGYDEMRARPGRWWAQVSGGNGLETWTRQKPWHGRSGGALVDPATGHLIGTVVGYDNWRGIYTGHAAIARFLKGR